MNNLTSEILEPVKDIIISINKEKIIILRSINDLIKYNVKFKKQNITSNQFFSDFLIIALNFFDASLPNRVIKRVNFKDGNITIITNKNNILISTMDLHHYLYFIKIPKLEIDSIDYE